MKKSLLGATLLLTLTVFIGSNAYAASQPVGLKDLIGSERKSSEMKSFLKYLKAIDYEKVEKSKTFISYRGRSSSIQFWITDDVVQRIRYDGQFALNSEGLKIHATTKQEELPEAFNFQVNCDRSKVYADLGEDKAFFISRYPLSIVPEGIYMTSVSYYVGFKKALQSEGYGPVKVDYSSQPSFPGFTFKIDENFRSNKGKTFKCVSGDCLSSKINKCKVIFNKPKDGLTYTYEGLMKNGTAEGQGSLTVSGSGGNLIFSGVFTEGSLRDGIKVVSTFDENSRIRLEMYGIASNEGYIHKLSGTLQHNSKVFEIEWLATNNHLYDIPNKVYRLPGQITLKKANAKARKGYNYIIETTGYLFPFSLNNFMSCSGFPLRGEIVHGDGKDYLGRYYMEGYITHKDNVIQEEDLPFYFGKRK